jgi:hypothetical protein
MTRRVLLAAALTALVAMSAGCQAVFDIDVDIDRDGRGTLALRLALDRDAQEALGISTDDDPAVAAERFAPMLTDGGWSGGDTQIAAARDDDSGELVLETSHPVDSIDQLEDLLSLPRPISQIAPDPSTLAALPDLPADAPLLNAVDVRLGEESGDNPGFNFFARGGVGDIGDETCKGDATVGFGRSLRDALQITYRFRLPGGPGDTNADDTPGGQNVWRAQYGDCPPLQASSGGGSSSTLVNGLILAVLAGIVVIVFALRGLRRRRGRRESS